MFGCTSKPHWPAQLLRIDWGSGGAASCRKVGDLLDGTFGDAPGQTRHRRHRRNTWAWPPLVVLEPMCALYRFTGAPAISILGKYLVRAYDTLMDSYCCLTLSSRSVYRTAKAKRMSCFQTSMVSSISTAHGR